MKLINFVQKNIVPLTSVVGGACLLIAWSILLTHDLTNLFFGLIQRGLIK